jgi:hypothetical protein
MKTVKGLSININRVGTVKVRQANAEEESTKKASCGLPLKAGQSPVMNRKHF